MVNATWLASNATRKSSRVNCFPSRRIAVETFSTATGKAQKSWRLIDSACYYSARSLRDGTPRSEKPFSNFPPSYRTGAAGWIKQSEAKNLLEVKRRESRWKPEVLLFVSYSREKLFAYIFPFSTSITVRRASLTTKKAEWQYKVESKIPLSLNVNTPRGPNGKSRFPSHSLFMHSSPCFPFVCLAFGSETAPRNW